MGNKIVNVSADAVKKLRDQTGLGMMDCKNALVESNNDMSKAVVLLRVNGLKNLEKRDDKETLEGVISNYIHPGDNLGVMVEVNCETDFVAKTEDFKEFAKNIAMHIAASDPMTVDESELDPDFIANETEIFTTQAIELNKSEKITEIIIKGKLKKRLAEVCLLGQPFVKMPDKKVRDYLTDMIAKLGEKITIKRFVRFKLGE